MYIPVYVFWGILSLNIRVKEVINCQIIPLIGHSVRHADHVERRRYGIICKVFPRFLPMFGQAGATAVHAPMVDPPAILRAEADVLSHLLEMHVIPDAIAMR